MNKEILEKEVKDYNSIIEEIQKLQIELNKLEQQRLVKFGRVQLIQENLEENDVTIEEIK